ncbi:type II toxin-antitoxin system VapC family toxin [Picrophilus oshimae]|uniref:Predicted nucleic acid-binding protein, contains PIN domain n=1 Tax=Picrophilus torridus (strain ATCC 700027 / DSM 9790 / JCM 10055 / NBRC 100828 / KAW 2/3) TaxID=1122961 RepID=A0A8G2FWN4_PICTO|nr:type II toxin-antitoxin system VapC family toxin [Picrophilus oshimae]SMD30834.1 Predicted nucleic acid-binding protein, contains PIN domain [Picrophilus oshimae DSM 9789]
MEYIDTNILISLINKNDNKHNIANELIKKYNDIIITQLNILEMRSVLSRVPVTEEEIDALIEYLFIKTNIKFVEIDINKALKKSGDIINSVKLKTLDCIHIASAIILNADKFITFNKDFKIKEVYINKYGMEIINPL